MSNTLPDLAHTLYSQTRFIFFNARILQPLGFTLGIVAVTVLVSLDNFTTFPLLFRFTSGGFLRDDNAIFP